MKKSSLLSFIAAVSICSTLLGFSPSSKAATVTNLLTLCTSATTTTQASKCTAWQYNVYSPTAYIESYPQVSPGPTGYTDPNYAYRLASTVTQTMGVKVCPTALTPGTSYTSAAADPCPNNRLVAASTVLPSHFVVSTGNSTISAFSVESSIMAPLPGSPYSLTALSLPNAGVSNSAPSLVDSALIGDTLYVLWTCCSPDSVASIASYHVSLSGLTVISTGVGQGPGPGISSAIAMFSSSGYLYLVFPNEQLPTNGFLETFNVSNGSIIEPISQLDFGCRPTSASYDPAASLIVVSCGSSFTSVSVASAGNPVAVQVETVDSSKGVVGN
jgi:hypothetical protein